MVPGEGLEYGLLGLGAFIRLGEGVNPVLDDEACAELLGETLAMMGELEWWDDTGWGEVNGILSMADWSESIVTGDGGISSSASDPRRDGIPPALAMSSMKRWRNGWGKKMVLLSTKCLSLCYQPYYWNHEDNFKNVQQETIACNLGNISDFFLALQDSCAVKTGQKMKTKMPLFGFVLTQETQEKNEELMIASEDSKKTIYL